MSAPKTTSIAKRIARLRQDDSAPDDPKWDDLDPDAQRWMVESAETDLARMRSAGLVVVELPDSDNHLGRNGALPIWYDPRSDNAWRPQPGRVCDDFGMMRDASEVRLTALVMLAVSAEADRMAGKDDGHER